MVTVSWTATVHLLYLRIVIKTIELTHLHWLTCCSADSPASVSETSYKFSYFAAPHSLAVPSTFVRSNFQIPRILQLLFWL